MVYNFFYKPNYNEIIPPPEKENLKASVANPNETPATGQSIPVFVGTAKISGTIIWAKKTTASDGTSISNKVAVCFGRNTFQVPLTLKELYVAGEKISLGKVKFYDGVGNTVSSVISNEEGTAKTPAFTGYVYLTMSNIKSTSDIVAIVEATAGDVPLPELIEKICAYSGVASADIVTQNLSTYNLKGMLLSGTTGSVELLTRIGDMYSYEFVESDNKLKFIKKRTSAGVTLDQTLTMDELVETETETVEVTKNSAYNTLNSLSLEFVDSDSDYEINTVTAARPIGSSFVSAVKREGSFSAPICIPLETAKSLAYETLYSIINGSTAYRFILPPEYLYIEPGDTISMNVSGQNVIMLVTSSTINGDFSNEIDAVSFTASAQTTLVVDDPYVPVVDIEMADVHIIPLDIPLLLADHDLLGTAHRNYHALTTYDAVKPWYGAYSFSSYNSEDFFQISSWAKTSPPTAVGTAVNILPAPALLFATDTVNQLRVTVTGGSKTRFRSTTYTNVLNRTNGCAAYGSHGRWEIIAWETCTTLPGGDILLTNLQRGLLGSEQYWDTHAAGDQVIYINWNATSECAGRILGSIPLTQRGLDTEYAAKPPSTAFLDTNNQVTRQMQGVAEKPYAPVQLNAVLDVSGDISLTWVRRSRRLQVLTTSASTIDEATEAYEIDIMNGAAVARTINATTQAATYAAADILADFGAPQTSLTFKVYQISATVGRGYAGTATIAL